MTFAELCKLLATDAGGDTLWGGAGSAGAGVGQEVMLPTWFELTDSLLKKAGTETPLHWSALEMPDRLEFLSDQLGHVAFRKELRDRLLIPMQKGLDWHTAVQQAMTGSRASAVVCF